MLMTAAQWKQRIENEYKAMCAYPINSIVSWKPTPGQTFPGCKSYDVTYNLVTMIKAGSGLRPTKQKTVVRITLPDDPSGSPTARIIDGEIPFHPNIYINGNFCIGDIWMKEPYLWKLVNNLGKVIAFDPAHTNPESPANSEAATSWKLKMTGLNKPYPCGTISFPHPVGY